MEPRGCCKVHGASLALPRGSLELHRGGIMVVSWGTMWHGSWPRGGRPQSDMALVRGGGGNGTLGRG